MAVGMDVGEDRDLHDVGVELRARGGIAVLAAVVVAEGAARVLRPRGEPITPSPVNAASYFSPAELARARRFRRFQLPLGLGASALEIAVLAAWRRRFRRPALEGAALTVATGLASLPLRALARERSRRVGLVTQSWRGWGVDLAKGTAIGAAMSAAAAEAAAAGIRRWPRGWWLPGAGAAVAVAGGFVFAAPVLLDPIFNRFEPLPEGETRAAVL